MKKKKSNRVLNIIFGILFFSFLVVYFSEVTGYYEYKNHKLSVLTQEQIDKFESDVASGKEIDINDYVVIQNKKYNNKLSKITSKLSDGISKVVKTSVENTFKFLSNLIEEK